MKDNSEKESRCFKSEIRAVQTDSATVVRGYAAKFDSLSENLGGFREIIAPGAFDAVLDNDVRALLNHDSNKVLGRTKAGTLRIGVDATGLYYEYDSPNTSYANDLLESLKRGDVDQSSFQFFVETDDWKEDTEGRLIRTITKVSRLLDVAPVTFPAYPDTTVAKRSMEEIIKQKQPEPDNSWMAQAEANTRTLTLLNLNKL